MQLNMKIVLFQVLLLAVQGISYLAVQHTRRPVHDMARPIDAKIPLIPQFVFIYVLWYPLIAVFPLMLYECNTELYGQYIFAIIIDLIISLLVYWFYPASFTRPKVLQDSLSGRALSIIYIVDYKGLNCMPSMHCSQCFIIMYYAIRCTAMMDPLQIGLTCLCAGIIMGTIFTKQHVIIDVVTALVLSIFCIFTASCL